MTATVSDQDVGGLARRAVRGAGWSAGGQAGRQLVQLAISIVTARLLLPEHFGQVGQIVVLAGFANIISDFGLGSALVQRKDLEERHRSSVLWVQLGLGALLTGVVMASAPLIASFYDQPELERLAVWLAPSFLFSSACTAQRALLTRAMRFRALATIDLVVLAVSGSVCITGAVAGLEVTSIVLQMLTLNVLTAALLWLASDWRPRFELDRAAVRELLPFSGNLTAFTALNYVVRKGDNLLIGRFLGPAQLGLYARGYSTLLYPTRQISSVLGNVMFSSLAKVSDDAERMRRVYLRAVGVIALVTFPLMSGLALVADRFVPAVLGPNWVEAVPLVRLFALLGITESLFTTVGWIYRATGRTDVLLRMGMVVGIAPLAGIVIGLQFGTVQAVAIGYGISTTLLMYPVVRIGGSMIGMPVRDLVRTVKPVALCAAAMATVVLAVRAVLPPMNDLAAVMLLASAGAGTYIGLVHLLRIGPYVDLREQVRTHLRPRRRVTA